MTNFKYSLDSSQKFDCPKCGATNKYVRYRNNITGEWLVNEYGKCDRENSCGYWVMPDGNEPIYDKSMLKIDNERSIWIGSTGDYLTNKFYDNFVKGELGGVKYTNNFMIGIKKEFGMEAAAKVYREYNLGTFYDGGVVFPYYGNRHIVNNKFEDLRLITGKIMWYDDNLHRIKNGKKSYPRWLHNFDYKKDNSDDSVCSNISENYRADYGFFGWNYDMLKIDEHYNIGIVESEKTAIIMSIIVPQIKWIASGGLNQIGQTYKWRTLLDKNLIILPDYGFLKRTNQTTFEYWNDKIYNALDSFGKWNNYEIVDYIPPYATDEEKYKMRDDGIDVADLVLANKIQYIPFIKEKLLNYIK